MHFTGRVSLYNRDLALKLGLPESDSIVTETTMGSGLVPISGFVCE